MAEAAQCTPIRAESTKPRWRGPSAYACPDLHLGVMGLGRRPPRKSVHRDKPGSLGGRSQGRLGRATTPGRMTLPPRIRPGPPLLLWRRGLGRGGHASHPGSRILALSAIRLFPPHEPQCERNGPLSLSLSPSEGERVPKAGEGLVHGCKARVGSGNSLPDLGATFSYAGVSGTPSSRRRKSEAPTMGMPAACQKGPPGFSVACRSPRAIPKGLHHSAQGCEARATPGAWSVGAATLKGLHRLSLSWRSIPHIPFVVCELYRFSNSRNSS